MVVIRSLSPQLGRVLLFDLGPLVDEAAVLLQKLDALLRVQGDIVVLVLSGGKRKSSKGQEKGQHRAAS